MTNPTTQIRILAAPIAAALLLAATAWHSRESTPAAKAAAAAAQQLEKPQSIDSHQGKLGEVPVVDKTVQLCQALGPAAPYPIWAVDSAATAPGCGEAGWDARGMVDWQRFAQGEYVGHARTPHVSEYRLRPADALAFVYRRTRAQLGRAYELQVGDVVRVESLTADRGAATGKSGDQSASSQGDFTRELIVQPDGTISLPLIGQVHAAGRSIAALRDVLEERYKKFIRVPSMTVTPIRVNTRLDDLLEAVDARAGVGGLQFEVQVTPAGTIMLPALGEVFVQGLTLSEVKMEVDARYGVTIPGVEVTPVITRRAPRFVFVLGEVDQSGQFELQGPTTVMQAIALAGGWKMGANLRQVVVFRRGPDWRLMATMVDVKGALYARRPVPADDIWLNDSDIVLVPKSPIRVLDEFIEQVFTRGLYAAIPSQIVWGLDFASTSAVITTE